eukprot:3594067-Alexandrium_andersonii.AAC.1
MGILRCPSDSSDSGGPWRPAHDTCGATSAGCPACLAFLAGGLVGGASVAASCSATASGKDWEA